MNVLFIAAALLPLASPVSPVKQVALHSQGLQAVRPALLPRVAATPLASVQACALVTVSRHDTAKAIAERYGVTPSALTLDSAQGPRPLAAEGLPVGGVVRIALSLSPDTGRLSPGIRQVQVQSGDTLSRVARRYGLSERELVSLNLGLESLDNLQVGDTLNIATGVRGLLLTIKHGQTAAELIHMYHADPLWTARVNMFSLPTELHAGDQLLLPGIFAKSLHDELLARRVRAEQQAKDARIMARYQTYLAWKEARMQQRQEQYQRYQAWLKSPEHLAEVQKVQRQADYERWLAHETRAQAIAQAAAQAEQEAQFQQQAQQQAQQRADLRLQQAQVTGMDTRPQMQLAAAAERSAPDLHLLWPLEHPKLTSRFGEQDIAFHQEVFHSGQDMAAPEGTPIHAAADGTVTKSGDGAFGLNVYIQQESNTFIYGHMSQSAVTVGQEVKAGDLIGYVGCTGECTGPHLHFEIRIGNVPVDPLAFLP